MATFPLWRLLSQQIQFHWEVVIDVQLENVQREGPGKGGGGGEVVGFFPLLCLPPGPCRAELGAGLEGSLQGTAGGGKVVSTL